MTHVNFILGISFINGFFFFYIKHGFFSFSFFYKKNHILTLYFVRIWKNFAYNDQYSNVIKRVPSPWLLDPNPSSLCRASYHWWSPPQDPFCKLIFGNFFYQTLDSSKVCDVHLCMYVIFLLWLCLYFYLIVILFISNFGVIILYTHWTFMTALSAI